MKYTSRTFLVILFLFLTSCDLEPVSNGYYPDVDFPGGVPVSGGEQPVVDNAEENRESDEGEPEVLPTPVGGGGWIAYQSWGEGDLPVLYKIRPDGSQPSSIGSVSGYYPVWSPDGAMVVYAAPGNGETNDLFIVNITDNSTRRLTNTSADEGIPAWSPDGQNVVITRQSGDFVHFFLYSFQFERYGWQITYDDQFNHTMPTYSPDSRQLAYAGDSGALETSEIFVMNVEERRIQQVTINSFPDYYPAWSPDGTQIAYVSEETGVPQIYLMDVDGANSRQLTDIAEGAYRPAWSPDGQVIAFHSMQDGTNSIYLVDLESGLVWMLVQNASHPAWSIGD